MEKPEKVFMELYPSRLHEQKEGNPKKNNRIVYVDDIIRERMKDLNQRLMQTFLTEVGLWGVLSCYFTKMEENIFDAALVTPEMKEKIDSFTKWIHRDDQQWKHHCNAIHKCWIGIENNLEKLEEAVKKKSLNGIEGWSKKILSSLGAFDRELNGVETMQRKFIGAIDGITNSKR